MDNITGNHTSPYSFILRASIAIILLLTLIIPSQPTLASHQRKLYGQHQFRPERH